MAGGVFARAKAQFASRAVGLYRLVLSQEHTNAPRLQTRSATTKQQPAFSLGTAFSCHPDYVLHAFCSFTGA